MGAEESKPNSSASYDVSKESKDVLEGVLELPQDIHKGPIHSLAVVDEHHLLSGGTDKVGKCVAG